jgi:hypothetical protein
MERLDPSIAEIRKSLPGEDRKDGARPEGVEKDESKVESKSEPSPEAAASAPDAPKPE